MLNNAGLWQLIRQTCTHLSLTLCCPCLLFQKWWMGKYLSLCVIRWPINRSKVGGFHSYTHTHKHAFVQVLTHRVLSYPAARERRVPKPRHHYYRSLSLALSGLVSLSSQRKITRKAEKKNLPRIPCWASSSSIEISRLYLVILSAPLRPPSLT